MKWIFLCLCAWIMLGCVDVKIASNIDNISYLHLQPQIQSYSCKIPKKLALLDIRAMPPYYSNNIYILNSKHIDVLKAQKWIALPQDMLQRAFVFKAKEQCFEVSMPPLGTQRLQTLLKLSLLSLQIVEENNTYKAQISVFYELISTNLKSKSGVIQSSKTIESLSDSHITQGFALASDEVLIQILRTAQKF
ncbi:hypothetical protein [Helicobacter typhlonius]|uniref:hypothetical protein n=1 Tax=Helicobacter typhlonius TaxID=76936 RepID=UPI002FE01457